MKMATAQVIETSVTVNNNSPIQDYVHPDDQTQPTFDTLINCKTCCCKDRYLPGAGGADVGVGIAGTIKS